MKHFGSLTFLVFLCVGLNAQHFKLTGTVNGMDTGYILLRYNDEINQKQTAVCRLQKGKFYFEGSVNKIADVLLSIDSTKIGSDFKTYRYLYVEPGNSILFFPSMNLNEVVYTGSNAQEDWDSLRKIKRPYALQRIAYSKVIDSVRKELKNATIAHSVADSILNVNVGEAERIGKQMINIEIEFIQKNPSSYAAFTVLRELVGYISVDSIDLLYQQIDKRNLGCYLDNDFVRYFNRYRKSVTDEYPFDRIEIGKKAPDFQVWNAIDSPMDFRSLNLDGQITIIEFWGIHCIPCLKQNLIIDSLNKSTGFKIKILAVSNTDDLDFPQLIKYIERNRFVNWMYILLNQPVSVKNSGIFYGKLDKYKGAGIPRTVVIDKKGYVVFTKSGYSQEQTTEMAEIIKKLLSESE